MRSATFCIYRSLEELTPSFSTIAVAPAIESDSNVNMDCSRYMRKYTGKTGKGAVLT